MNRKTRILLVTVVLCLLSVMAISTAIADIYVTSWWGGGVWHFDNSGVYQGRNYSIGGGTQLAWGPDKMLYAADSSAGYIYKLDPNTSDLTTLQTVYTATGGTVIYGATFGPDGDLYIAIDALYGNYSSRRVAHIAGPYKSNAFTELTPQIDGTWPLWHPLCIAFGPDGMMYISDYNFPAIQRWGNVLQPNTFISTYVSGIAPVPVFGPDQNLYAGGNQYQGPFKSNPGALIGQFPNLTGSGLTSVNAVAFNALNGDIYAHDGSLLARFAGPNKVNAGSYLNQVVDLEAAGVTNPGNIVITPRRVVTAPTTGLYMTSYYSSIAQWNMSGTFVKNIPDTTLGTQLAFGPDGDLYSMSSGFGGYVTRYDGVTGVSKGMVISAYPYDNISAMAFGPDDDIYISYLCVSGDWGSRRVFRFAGPTKSNPFVYQSCLIGGDSRLYSPHAMTFGPDGDLYVSDGSLRAIQRWGGPGSSVSCKGNFVSNISGIPVFGPDNNLYVGANRYQGPFGTVPGQLIDQFVQWSGSGLTGVKCIAFNPVDGDIYAHDGAQIARFVGPGKTNEGTFVSIFASISSGGLNKPRQMIFAPLP